MQVETLECVGWLTVSSCRGIRTEFREAGLSGGSGQNLETSGLSGASGQNLEKSVAEQAGLSGGSGQN